MNQRYPKRQALARWRVKQAALAIYRDCGLCAFHYFLLGVRVPKDDVHHVYGRGIDEHDSREGYRSLLSTCRACHPLPIKFAGANEELAYVEDVLRRANETPINSAFKHPEVKKDG